MTYLSSFTGQQIDKAIAAVKSGIIDAGVFRAKLGPLTSSVVGDASEITISPLVNIGLEAGDPLIGINQVSSTVYEFEVDLEDGQSLSPGTSVIPIRSRDGDPLNLDLQAQDPISLQGESVFDRFDNVFEALDLQDISISNLANSLVLNNSVGVLARLSSNLEGEDITSLSVTPTLIRLSKGDKFVLLDISEFNLVEAEIAEDTEKESTTLLLEHPIQGTFEEDTPCSITGDSFINQIALDQDQLQLISVSGPRVGNIGTLEESAGEGDTSIIIDNLEVDLKEGDECYITRIRDLLEVKFTVGYIAPTQQEEEEGESGTIKAGLSKTIPLEEPLEVDLDIEDPLFMSPSFLKSQLTLAAGSIELLVTKDTLDTFVTIEADPSKITFKADLFASNTWSGEMDSENSSYIKDFSDTEGSWAITGASHFDFFQDSSNYFRSKGAGFLFRGNIMVGGAQGEDDVPLIDDEGYIDNSIGGSKIISGSIIANKLEKASRKYGTNIEITASSHYQVSISTVDGSPGYVKMGSDSQVVKNDSDTFYLYSGRNYIYFDINTETIKTSDSLDVTTDPDKVFMATAYPAPYEGEDSQNALVIQNVGVSSLNGEHLSPNSVTTDSIRANSITGVKIDAQAINGDHISAKSKIVIGDAPEGGTAHFVVIHGQHETHSMWAGNNSDSPEGAPLQFLNNGNIVVSNATVSGFIHIDGGQINNKLEMGANGSIDIGDGALVISPDDGIKFGLETNFGEIRSISWGDNVSIGANISDNTDIIQYRAERHSFRTVINNILEGSVMEIHGGDAPHIMMGSPVTEDLNWRLMGLPTTRSGAKGFGYVYLHQVSTQGPTYYELRVSTGN